MVAIIIIIYLIYKHLKNYTNQNQQLWIVRILFLIPLYSIGSLISLKFYEYSVYIDVVRDVYEAFVIYSFMMLCFEYLGGKNIVLYKLRDNEFKKSYITCTCCVSNISYNIKFIRFCKRGTLQFCVIKPLMSMLIIIINLLGYYHDGNINLTTGYFWISIIYNISIFIALYSLLLFYEATKDFLSSHKPILKFLCVKSVIFLSFWQSFVIAGLVHIGYIKDSGDGVASAAELAICYQNFIICIEMFLISIVYNIAFSADQYIKNISEYKADNNTFYNFKEAINIIDIAKDTIINFNPKYVIYVQNNNKKTEDYNSNNSNNYNN